MDENNSYYLLANNKNINNENINNKKKGIPFWIKFKKKHPNIYIVIISICIVMWFRGITGIIDVLFVPSNKIFYFLIISLFPLLILYMDDFSFSELYNPITTNNDQQARNAAVGTIVFVINTKWDVILYIFNSIR